MSANLLRSKAAWGDTMPMWVSVLASACDHASQKRVSGQINYSSAVVNQVLGNKYPGDMSGIRIAVEGALMGHTVHCPELGDMRADVCLRHQAAKFAATNHLRVRLYKACRSGCPHSRLHDHKTDHMNHHNRGENDAN